MHHCIKTTPCQAPTCFYSPLDKPTVSADTAQENYDALVTAGVRAVLNFTPTRVQRNPDIPLKNVDLRINLEELAFVLGGGSSEG